MGETYRCSDCAIDFPYGVRWRNCLACDEPCTPFSHTEPHDDWPLRVQQRKREIAEAENKAPSIPEFSAPVSCHDDRLFVDSRDVINAGIQHQLQSGQLLKIGAQTFEVQGYLDDRREYWIESFAVEVDDEQLAEWLGLDGPLPEYKDASDDPRGWLRLR